VRVGTEEDWRRYQLPFSKGEAGSEARDDTIIDPQPQILEIPMPGDDLCERIKLYAYPDFGLYIYRSKRLYLSIRCGAIGQNGNGGHAHNDQLSIELNVDGVDWIADPGTYLYTPLPKRRNDYRSVKAHFAPQVEGIEPSRLDLGLFSLGGKTRARCLYFGKEGFVGIHQGYGKPVYRAVQVLEDRVHIMDHGEGYMLSQGAINNIKVGLRICPKSPKLSIAYGVRYV
jgi:hypothetical protein